MIEIALLKRESGVILTEKPATPRPNMTAERRRVF
jgi:hypothetical protein